jgi:hypothetical protein
MTATHRLAVFLAIAFVSVVVTVIIAPRPIPQDQLYHQFADTRPFLGIPNFGNTASSIVFVLAGVIGLVALRGTGRGMAPEERFIPAVIFCIGAILTGAGSTVYHWHPLDASLVFDRLGMVIAFAAFIALLMSHFDIAGARVALPIFLVAGVGSVLYWICFGDLRPYGIFQAFPVILFVVGSLVFPRMHTRHAMLWLVTIGYVLAKVCESLDRRIYDMGGILSGHTLKHLIAGLSLGITIAWLEQRRPVSTSVNGPAS